MNKDVKFISPRVQCGIVNTRMQLQCNFTHSIFAFVNIMWKNHHDESMSGTIESLKFTDEGRYKCEISFNEILLGVTHFVQLIVLGK